MSNPILRANIFNGDVSSNDAMTVNGAIHKSVLLAAICGVSAWFCWQLQNPALLMLGLVIGLVLALVISFKPTTAPYLSPAYAAAEGAVLGTISVIFEAQSHGITLLALMLTGGVFCTMLGAYHTGLIRPTRMLFNVVAGATGGICLVYLVSMIAGFFGHSFSIISGSGPWSIGFSVIICLVAAFNLIMDFALIEQGAAQRAPKYMEWYAAFGLLVTLVWLYLEILRLLAKSRK